MPHGGPLPEEEDLDAALAQAMQTAMSSSGLAAPAAVVSSQAAPKKPERRKRDTGEAAFQATIQFNKDQMTGSPAAPPGPAVPPQGQPVTRPPQAPRAQAAPSQAPPAQQQQRQQHPPQQVPVQQSQDGDFVSSLLDEIDWDELSLEDGWRDENKEG